MERTVVGLIVAGGTPLDILGLPHEAALTPFGGKYRFIDFALATLANSRVATAGIAAPSPSLALRSHLARAARARGRRPALVPLPGTAAPSRAGRLLQALAGCRDLLRAHEPATLVVLLADHILQLDVRQLVRAHRDLHADVTLASLPLPVGEAAHRTVLRVGGDQRVHDVQHAPLRPATAPGSRGFALGWAGDLVIDTEALPTLLDALAPDAARDDAGILEPLVERLRVMAYDVLDNRLPGRADGGGAYWHEATSIEAYYDAHMDLCTPRPTLDLYNSAWPVLPVATGLGPAKVVADAAGRAGQALNTLVSDGSVIRGGVAINTVLGHGVVIESGAEVEDSVLLDGCRIGRGARVRRAVVGAGAVVPEEARIGYEVPPAPPWRAMSSGLTIVPSGAAPEGLTVAEAP